jgi:hypothetical protein
MCCDYWGCTPRSTLPKDYTFSVSLICLKEALAWKESIKEYAALNKAQVKGKLGPPRMWMKIEVELHQAFLLETYKSMKSTIPDPRF